MKADRVRVCFCVTQHRKQSTMSAFRRAKLFKQPNIRFLTWGQFAVMQLAKTQGTFTGQQAVDAVCQYQNGVDKECVQAVVELLVETGMLRQPDDQPTNWYNQRFQLNF